MAVQIHYMGAKHNLAPHVANEIATLPKGPCLDLFAGMCSVAGELAASHRQAWCNDVQAYAALVAQVLVASHNATLTPTLAVNSLTQSFTTNVSALKDRFREELTQEYNALQAEHYGDYLAMSDQHQHIGNNDSLRNEAKQLRIHSHTFPYRLATITYAMGYFGLRQSIEIDSIRYALDECALVGMITQEQRNFGIVALLQASSLVATSPGHFAQFLRVRDQKTFGRIARYRIRSVWHQFLAQLPLIHPYGSNNWRESNRVLCEEALQLSTRLATSDERIAVVYADPPYSDAQYSRYYHVLETLCRYDYPESTGQGRYRNGRHQTTFSNLTTVKDAFEQLCSNVAKMESNLVLSYPSNGLYFEVAESIEPLLKRHFRKVTSRIVNARHSTLGGPPGRASLPVDELIWTGRGPR